MNRILKAMLKLAVPITGLAVFTSCVASFYRDNSPENTFRIDNRTEYELVFQSRWSPETVCPAGENTLLANGQAEDRFTVLGNYHRLVVRSGEGEETFMFDELMNAPLRRYYLEESNWEMEAEGLTGDDSGEDCWLPSQVLRHRRSMPGPSRDPVWITGTGTFTHRKESS